MHPPLDTITTDPAEVVTGLAALDAPGTWEPTPEHAARAFHVLTEVARGATDHGKPARNLAARKMYELAHGPQAEAVDAILSADTIPSDGPFRFEDATLSIDGEEIGGVSYVGSMLLEDVEVHRRIKWTPPMIVSREILADREALGLDQDRDDGLVIENSQTLDEIFEEGDR